VTAVALGWLILAFSMTPFLGPLHKTATPEKLEAQNRAIATLPGLVGNTGLAHVRQIYAEANLTQTNPAFVLFGALWAGMALALVRGVDRRAKTFLAAVAIFSIVQLLSNHTGAVRLDKYLPISQDARNWLPPPILPAAIALVLALRLGMRERWAWAVAGAVFAILTYLTWGTGHPLMLVLIAVAVTMAGAWIGGRVVRMLENPVASDVRLIVPLLGVTFPLFTGIIDLYLRKTIG